MDKKMDKRMDKKLDKKIIDRIIAKSLILSASYFEMMSENLEKSLSSMEGDELEMNTEIFNSFCDTAYNIKLAAESMVKDIGVENFLEGKDERPVC